ncbi:MAG: glucans biosynthesis glucosyltransferase MdoH [Paracoccaceae bacterium]
MPKPAPLEMPVQDFGRQPTRRFSEEGQRYMRLWRMAVFIPALALTGLVLWGMFDLFQQSGLTALEYVLLGLIALTFVWVTLAVSTVGVGLAHRQDRRVDPKGQLNTALLIPIYNEVASNVFGNAAAMLDDLAGCAGDHAYTLFILSDTRDPEIAAQEEAAFDALSEKAAFPVYYRRREKNTDKKVGNLGQWITGWGADYDAMLVLDADSLMSGRAIRRLADEMAADPQAGLIQSYPQLIEADTLFARMQQFSNRTYGWLLAEGLAAWAQTECNYWGHNAIIRTRAFAEAAGLPHLKGLFGKRLIMSHDFVEASLLRRAGWRVRFLPHITGSFEETPGTLIDYVIRDRRWCRGNLQHLRLLGMRGLHPVSRFHLFQGAMAYLMSPAWFVLLVFWSLLGRDSETNVIRYFNEANPMFPNWPPEMTHLSSMVFLVIMYAMLLLPKVTAATLIAVNQRAVRRFGGLTSFLTAFLFEIILSVIYAPILMIQQTRAVLRGLFSRGDGWVPQSRNARAHSLWTLIGFHWVETVLGILLLTGLIAGLISPWLLPIMISLLLTLPLSALSAIPLGPRAPMLFRLDNPLTLHEPAIVSRARKTRAAFRADLEHISIPAE